MKIIFSCILLIAVISFSGCAFNMTSDVGGLLNPEILNASFKTNAKNLGAESKCPYPASVYLINEEKKEYPYELFFNGYTFNINPKELNDSFITYMKNALGKSGITVAPDSPKKLLISMNNVKVTRNGFSPIFNSSVQMNVNLPDMKINKIYQSNDESSLLLHQAVAYSIHVSTWKIIEDPLIQNYLLCF